MKKDKIKTFEKIIEEHTKKYDVICCDLCKKQIEEYDIDDYNGRDIKYDELNCEKDKPIIGMLTEEYCYGDCGGSTGEAYDICKDCYESKIKPLLKEQLGLEPRIVEYDW